MAAEEIVIRIDLDRGESKVQVLTCDLSYDYVKINAEYRTSAGGLRPGGIGFAVTVLWC